MLMIRNMKTNVKWQEIMKYTRIEKQIKTDTVVLRKNILL